MLPDCVRTIEESQLILLFRTFFPHITPIAHIAFVSSHMILFLFYFRFYTDYFRNRLYVRCTCNIIERVLMTWFTCRSFFCSIESMCFELDSGNYSFSQRRCIIQYYRKTHREQYASSCGVAMRLRIAVRSTWPTEADFFFCIWLTFSLLGRGIYERGAFVITIELSGIWHATCLYPLCLSILRIFC